MPNETKLFEELIKEIERHSEKIMFICSKSSLPIFDDIDEDNRLYHEKIWQTINTATKIKNNYETWRNNKTSKRHNRKDKKRILCEKKLPF